MATTLAAPGLEDIVMTHTHLSAIDGISGRLSYVGYDIHQLAEHASFEEVCCLLWDGELPSAARLAAWTQQLAAARTLTPAELALARSLPRTGHGMDALRSLVSGLGQLDPQASELTIGNASRVGMRVLAKLPGLIAAWHRLRRGLEPLPANPALSHAANLLWMLHGQEPSPAAEQALNTYLVLLAEHGLNASTFAARVAIGAQADVYGALTAAVATLKGLVHGGANEKAMETFLEIGSPERAPAVIAALLARHGRLMGVGHRIYKVEDPRVRHLRAAVAALSATDGRWQAVADAVAGVVASHPYFAERQLAPNVEFYSAPLLYLLGLPLDLFTCAFALSRTAGWVGHIGEQLQNNRLIRPKAAYDGPPLRPFVALAAR